MTTPQELDERFRAAVSALSAAVGPDRAGSTSAASPDAGGTPAASLNAGGTPAASPDVAPNSAVSAVSPVADATELAAVSATAGVSRRGPVRPGATLTRGQALELFDAQLASRHLDLAARWLRSFREAFATISSAGYEGNAAVAVAARASDPALLHDRSGGFYCARAGQIGDHDAIRDVLRAVVGSAADPISGGRGKSFAHPALAILPSGSTTASHLPRAIGLGYAVEQTRLLPRSGSAVGGTRAVAPRSWPADAIVVCSFTAADALHSVAQATLSTSGWLDHTGVRLPVLYVCEDDGVGAASPKDWVERLLRSRPGLRYSFADGCDLVAAHDAAAAAVSWVRRERRPAVLHLSTVRLLGRVDGGGSAGSAGSDGSLRLSDQLTVDLDRDPLIFTARLLCAAGLMSPKELLARYDEVGWQVRRVAEEVIAEPKLASLAEVVAPLAPRRPVRVARAIGEAASAAAGPKQTARLEAFGGKLPEKRGPLTLAATIQATLIDALIANPTMVLFGEDVVGRGGAYGVLKGLWDHFGDERVFDTVPDETSILGLALGAGLGGLLPVPEIGFLANLHQVEGQLRGEAAPIQFFSKGAVRNPMVVRVAGLAHQNGLGGHFLNDNAVAAFRDIPGLIVAVPSSAAEASALLRSCLASAEVDGSVCVFLEPIALYHARDLYAEGDNGWLSSYSGPDDWAREQITVGRARVHGQGEHLTIITFGNGVRMSLRVAAGLARRGIEARVVDLRWLAPLPVADIVREASATGRVLVVDETRRGGGVGEGVLAALVGAGYVGAARRVSAADSYLPLGPAARHLLVAEEMIEQGARSLLGG